MIGSLVVVANGALRKSRRRQVEAIVQTLRLRRREITLVTTGSANEATQQARDAIDRGAEAIIAAGGDGTVHSVLQAVAGTDTALGIIAAGTGNDIARALYPQGHRHTFTETRAVDAVSYDGGWFLGVGGMGLDARVAERTNSTRVLRGRLKYVLGMVPSLTTLQSHPFVIAPDGVHQEVDAVLIAIANTSTYGGAMKIAPDATPDDGLLDIVVVAKVTRRQLLTVFPRVYRGSHVHHPAVTVSRCKTLLITSGPGTAYADGEPLGPAPLTFECVPGAVKLLY